MKNLTFLCCLFQIHCFAQSSLHITDKYKFIENNGQVIDEHRNRNERIKYIWKGNGMNVHLKQNGFCYEVLKRIPSSNGIFPRKSFVKKVELESDDTIFTQRIDITFVGANANSLLVPISKSDYYFNYYTTGTSEQGIKNVHAYKKVIYKDVYPNIDIEYLSDESTDKKFKYNFIIKPGGKCSNIKIKYDGSKNIVLDSKSRLSINTMHGEILENIPLTYEKESGKQIKTAYVRNNDTSYSFLVDKYNPKNTLIIDPWATYFGGISDDGCSSVAIDKSQNIIMAGATSSSNIATNGAFQTTYLGSTDAFIAKFNKEGQLIWATYYGGNNNDVINSTTIDKNDNIICIGLSSSSNNIATNGAFQQSIPANGGAFISKFDSNGFRKWGTYYFANTYGRSVACDSNASIYAVGETGGAVIGLASTGSHQTVYGGGNGDAFVVKFDANGNRQWSTYYGGNGVNGVNSDDYGLGIATDNSCNVVITGLTSSINNIASIGSHQDTLLGGMSAYIVKFNTNGVRQWGTYYGGSLWDEGHAITTDNLNNIIISGTAESTNNIATPGSYQSTLLGNENAFIAKFNTNGVRQWGTYYGGSVPEDHGISPDNIGNIYLTGTTNSISNISTPNTYQDTLCGGDDAFLTKFSSSGIFKWGTYFGGKKDEVSMSVAASNNLIVIGGYTLSDSNIATSGAFQTLIGSTSYNDAFLAVFDSTGHIPPTGIQNFNEPTSSILIVYPNPAKEELIIQLLLTNTNKGKIIITDVIGKTVKNITVKSANITVNIKEFVTGIYFLTYQDGEVCETVKFVKE